MTSLRRQKNDLALGLGAVEYELLVLASAILLHRRLKNRASTLSPNPELELASDCIRAKSRTLLEFLTDHRRKRDRISAHDFGLRPRAIDLDLYRRLCTYSAHLGWGRAVETYEKSEAFRADDGLLLLREALDVCIQIHGQGHKFKPNSRYAKRHLRLKHQLKALGLSYV